MHKAQKKLQQPKVAAPKAAVKKTAKRGVKTAAKKIVKKAAAPVILNASFQPRRRFGAGPNNLQTPNQMSKEDAEKYNQMMPSSTATEQWEQQLESLNADVNVTMSTEVEEYLAEHGDTPVLWGSPAAVQYNIFKVDPQFEISKRLIGPPGTIEEPTMVFSPKPYRIVGCVGTLDNPHPLGWFSMEGYLKHMCPDCGQIFQLTNNPDECDFTFTDKVDNMAHFGSDH